MAARSPVTIKEIAQRTGLSMPTVCHVLGSRGHKYRPETRERVLEAARELGYRLHSSARAMRTGRYGAVALLLSTVGSRSTLPGSQLDAIHDALAEQDLHLTLTKVPDEKLTSEGFVPKILRQSMVDGLLLNYFADIPQRMVDLIHRHDIPSVWINSKQESDCVYPDDRDVGRRATEHLLRLGHRHIAYVDHPISHHYSAVDRRQGYQDAMKQAGLSPRLLPLERPESTTPAAREAGWLKMPERPTAVIAYAPPVAQALVYAALAQGLRVPEDLSVVSFSYEPVHFITVSIATWIVPSHDMGRTAVQMLVSKMEEPGLTLPPRVIPFRLLEEGATIAPPFAG